MKSVEEILARCREALPGWRNLEDEQVSIESPKGFSSFTLTLRPSVPVEPRAVLYRHLADKENAILDFETERSVFLLLGEQGLAARCYHYDRTCRIEELYEGRTLTADDLTDPEVLRAIARRLHEFHHLRPKGLPERSFFELLHERWGPLAERVLAHPQRFPEEEQKLCEPLRQLTSAETLEKVRRWLPDGPTAFCHNDTYHGNIFRLENGELRLLDFEFSCRNLIAFDFSNLFAETVMRHGLEKPPHFRIESPGFTGADIAALVDAYLDCDGPTKPLAREQTRLDLVRQTERILPMSHLMYAMAALPLALEPIQKIRFLPYSFQRFQRFLAAVR